MENYSLTALWFQPRGLGAVRVARTLHLAGGIEGVFNCIAGFYRHSYFHGHPEFISGSQIVTSLGGVRTASPR